MPIRPAPTARIARAMLPALIFPMLFACAGARTAVPTQFIAKMDSEALGRAPDPQGWLAAVKYFQRSGCSRKTLETWGSAALSSPEFLGLHYDPAALVLVLYRAILNREPDRAGYRIWYSALERGQSLSTVVAAFFHSREFERLVPAICSGESYSFGTFGTGLAIQTPMNHPGGVSGFGEAELQTLLAKARAGETVYLRQQSVIYLNRPLIIPAGVTLATEGLPDPRHHALMARLIRAAPFPAPMIEINVDATPGRSGGLRSLWIDGERSASTPYVSGATDVEIYGGNGASVTSSFLSGSLGWSTLHSYGALDHRPCASNIVTGNVVTAYASVHADGEWTDGLSIGCEQSLVEHNEVIDATDVGIVVFTAYPATQQSKVIDNTVVSAGNSAFGALAFDPLQNRSIRPPDFTGSEIADNVLWSGPNTHFIVGLAVGTRAWYPRGSIGRGASAVGNTTAGVPTHFGAGIVVSGMENATVQGNVLDDVPIDSHLTACPIGTVLASVKAGLAGGSIQPYSDEYVNGCMSDYSQAQIASAQAEVAPVPAAQNQPTVPRDSRGNKGSRQGLLAGSTPGPRRPTGLTDPFARH